MVDITQTASPFEVAYTIGALFNVLVFAVLLNFAIRDANQVRTLPAEHPDRMIAADGILNECIRLILLAGGMLALGLAAIVTPPAIESSEVNPSVLGVALFVVLVTWQIGLTLWGLKDLWFRRRLFRRMSAVRLICAESTFAECPFVKAPPLSTVAPESLVEPPPVPPEGESHDAG